MTMARQIADERLARGEITADDHAQIVSIVASGDGRGKHQALTLAEIMEPFGYLIIGMLLLAAAITFSSLGGPVLVLAYVCGLAGVIACAVAVYFSLSRTIL